MNVFSFRPLKAYKIFFVIVQICLFISITSLVACSNVQDVEADMLFDIPLGNMPGEFNTWNFQPDVLLQSFVLKNNVFYIANANRVLMYSSTGVLLNYIAPAYGVPYGKFSKYVQNNIQYYAYPLGGVTTIEADQDNVYIAHVLVGEAKQISDSFDLLQSKPKTDVLTQLLVYGDGAMKKIIGREGEKEFNFFSIQNMYSLKNKILVVKSREDQSINLYFYNSQGHLLQRFDIRTDTLPKFSGSEIAVNESDDLGLDIKVKPILANVIPSYDAKEIYMHIKYYNFYVDQYESTVKVEFRTNKIFTLDAKTGEYLREAEILDVDEYSNLWNVNPRNKLIFLSPQVVDNEVTYKAFKIIKVSAQNGKILQSNNLIIPDEEYLSYNLAYSHDNKIGGYFLEENKVKVVWWNVKGLKW